MFKIFNKKKQRNDEEPLITKARSKSDGIVFFSNKIPIAIDACVEKEKISIHIIPSLLDSMFEYNEKDGKIEKRKILFKRTLIFNVIFIFLSLFLKSFYITYSVMYFSLFISLELVMLINNFYDFDKHHRLVPKSVTRFHAAEHKAIKAYKKFRRVPTAQEIKKESSFSNNCGSNFTLMKLITNFTLFLSIFLSEFGREYTLFFLSLTIFLLILRVSGKNLIFLQFLVTAKPTDLQIECALRGIQELDKINSKMGKYNANSNEIVIKLGENMDIDEFLKYLSKNLEITITNNTSKN